MIFAPVSLIIQHSVQNEERSFGSLLVSRLWGTRAPSLLVSPTSTDGLASTRPSSWWWAWEARLPQRGWAGRSWREPLPLTHGQRKDEPGAEARRRQGVFRSKLPKPVD